jgi:hypothetical protein
VTAVDRPNNGQDEGARKSDAFAEWYSGPRAFMNYQIAFDAGWDAALASGRAGAGEQLREQVARWLADFECRSHDWSPDDDATWAQQRRFWLADADELLALLGGPQPDGEAVAWETGYAAAERDAEERPYSDRPEAATWKPTANPFRARVAREGGECRGA